MPVGSHSNNAGVIMPAAYWVGWDHLSCFSDLYLTIFVRLFSYAEKIYFSPPDCYINTSRKSCDNCRANQAEVLKKIFGIALPEKYLLFVDDDPG